MRKGADRSQRRFLSAALGVCGLGSGLLAGIGSVVAGAALTVDLGGVGATFSVPPYCATQEGPGTFEAVCDPEGDSEKSRAGPAASALYFEISVRSVPEDKGLSAKALADRYSMAEFQKDLPEAICGEEKSRGIKLDKPEQVAAADSLVYRITLTCPEVRFLGLPERKAAVRYELRNGRRILVQARSLSDDFPRVQREMDAFFASLKFEPERTAQ